MDKTLDFDWPLSVNRSQYTQEVLVCSKQHYFLSDWLCVCVCAGVGWGGGRVSTVIISRGICACMHLTSQFSFFSWRFKEPLLARAEAPLNLE